MFEELFPQVPPATYQDDAMAAGFRLVPGDLASDPDAVDLVSTHAQIYNCMIGTYEGRRVAIFEAIFRRSGGHQTVWTTLAFDIGDRDFSMTRSLDSYWNLHQDGHWVYFEVVNETPNFNEFLQQANAILEMYLL